jgi:hypothetical protein
MRRSCGVRARASGSTAGAAGGDYSATRNDSGDFKQLAARRHRDANAQQRQRRVVQVTCCTAAAHVAARAAKPGQHSPHKRAASATEGSVRASHNRSSRSECDIAAAVWHALPACATRAECAPCITLSARRPASERARRHKRGACADVAPPAHSRAAQQCVRHQLTKVLASCARGARSRQQRSAAASASPTSTGRAAELALQTATLDAQRCAAHAWRLADTSCSNRTPRHTPTQRRRQHSAGTVLQRGSASVLARSRLRRCLRDCHAANTLLVTLNQHTPAQAQRRTSSCASASPDGAGGASSRSDAAAEQSRTGQIA